MMDYTLFDMNGYPFLDTRIPYCNCKGEDALMRSDLFQKNRLSLFSCVPLAQVTKMLDPRSNLLQSRENSEYIDYLICRSKEILAVMIVERDSSKKDQLLSSDIPVLWNWDKEKKFLPVLLVREASMLKGQTAPLLEILQAVLNDSGRRPHQCSICFLPQSKFQRFLAPAHGLLSVCRDRTYITEYGRSLGLFRGRYSQNVHRICAFPQALGALEREMSRSPSFPSVSSFADRQKRVAEGLPCDKGSAMKAVRKFAMTPLSSYLRSSPESLRLFENSLGKNATVQDAARYVASVLREEQPGVCGFNDRPTAGKRLMFRLAEPFFP